MRYTDHYGKTKRVSDRRFSEFCKREENCEIWLNFRMKVFEGFSREELIMNPLGEVWLHPEGNLNEELLVIRFVNEIVFKVYIYAGEQIGEFSTPEKALQFANSYNK